MTRLILMPMLILVVFSSLSCTSTARRECDPIDWFHHGFGVGMSGHRLDGDPLVRKCQDAGAQVSHSELDRGFKAGMAKYCSADNVYAAGKTGLTFSYELCDGENEKKMRARHLEGVREFCVADNGYRYGADGGVYQDVCPKDLEAKWLTEYRRGRKVYLTMKIEQKTREAEALTTKLLDLQSRRSLLQVQHASVPNNTVIQTERVYDSNTNSYKQKFSQVPDESSNAQRRQLEGEISGVNWEIQRTRKTQEEIYEEISKMRIKVSTL